MPDVAAPTASANAEDRSPRRGEPARRFRERPCTRSRSRFAAPSNGFWSRSGWIPPMVRGIPRARAATSHSDRPGPACAAGGRGRQIPRDLTGMASAGTLLSLVRVQRWAKSKLPAYEEITRFRAAWNVGDAIYSSKAVHALRRRNQTPHGMGYRRGAAEVGAGPADQQSGRSSGYMTGDRGGDAA